MSTAPKRKKPTHGRSGSKDKSPLVPDDGVKRLLLVLGLVLVLAGIPFALGKYFEFSSPGAFDSGSYVYSAKHVLSGARIGYDEKPSAQAGTLLFNMLGVALCGFGERGAELLQMFVQAVALVFMFVTIRRLYGTLAGGVSVTIASIYLSAPLIAKYGNVKEQFMIAFMIVGICCFVFYQLKGKWWWAVLCGAALVWGPMFKQTGLSAIAATGLFVLAQPILHHTGWKNAGRDLLLLTAGAVAVLAPIGVWYASMDTPRHYWPYSFVFKPVLSAFTSDADGVEAAVSEEVATDTPAEPEKPERSLILRLLPGYVSDSWEALGPEARTQAFKRVLRYYRLLILPILLALGALVVRPVVLWRRKGAKPKDGAPDDAGRFVLLLAVWWFFDMAFVWISPRSYEQYYLPLNASAAMLGGYLVHLFTLRLQSDRDKTRWIVLGLLGLVLMMALSWHIFFGIAKSPHSGTVYRNARTQLPERRRGYRQKWQEVSRSQTFAWERAGQYVFEHSEPTDKIYVWGWVPGIYVKAQRFSASPKAFEGTMSTLPPAELQRRVREILEAFETEAPEFIVDTQKNHFPWDRPPLELWPNIRTGPQLLDALPTDRQQLWNVVLRTFDVQSTELTREGFLRADKPDAIARFDTAFGARLREKIEPDEAARYEAMKPFRAYVMGNYKVVSQFPPFVVFGRK